MKKRSGDYSGSEKKKKNLKGFWEPSDASGLQRGTNDVRTSGQGEQGGPVSQVPWVVIRAEKKWPVGPMIT